MAAIPMGARRFVGSAFLGERPVLSRSRSPQSISAHPSHHPRITQLPCKKRANGHLGDPVGGRGFVQHCLGLAEGLKGTGLRFRVWDLGFWVEGLGIGVKV